MAMFVDGIPVAGGIPGVGIPKGGTDGQLLAKDGKKNYHGRWASPGDVALLPPKGYTGSPVTIPTRSTDLLAPSWTGQTTVTGTPSPDSPATLTGVPFAATATGPDGQTRSVDLDFTGYSLPDGTADSYDGARGDFVQRIGKVILDGTEDWRYKDSVNEFYVLNILPIPAKSNTETNSKISTHFESLSLLDVSTSKLHTNSFRFANENKNAIQLNWNDSSDLSAFKNFLAAQAAAGTPVTVYYALAQPVAYNQKADLRAFDGQTTVTGVDTVDVIEGRVLRVADCMPFEIVRSNPNLADNWYLINPINQRGKTDYTGHGVHDYTIDRYYLATQAGNVKVENDGTLLTLGSLFWQLIEAKIKGPITFSVLSEDNKLYSVSVPFFSDTTNQNVNTDFGSIRIQNVNGMLGVNINTTKTEKKFIALKPEFSLTQTLARKVGGQWVLNDPPPDPTLELLKCQRYQLSLLDPLITGQSYIFKGNASEPSRFYGVLPTPVPMRTIPRVITDCSESAPYLAFGITSTGYYVNIQITEIGAYSKMQHGVILFARASDIVRGNDYQVYIKNTNTHQFLLDANL